VHLEKEVVPWFQMQARNHAFPSWVAFTRALEMSFGPSPYECPRSDLFKLTQSGSVHEYYVKFTVLANRVQGITSEALLDCFVGGLRQDIRRDVLVQDPKTLMRCVSLAKLFEEKYAAQRVDPNRRHCRPHRRLPFSFRTNAHGFPLFIDTPLRSRAKMTLWRWVLVVKGD